jgi:hypothetical protein
MDKNTAEHSELLDKVRESEQQKKDVIGQIEAGMEEVTIPAPIDF